MVNFFNIHTISPLLEMQYGINHEKIVKSARPLTFYKDFSFLKQIKLAQQIFKYLKAEYPDAKTELNHQNPFQLLIATILSAQTTDVRVNIVTPSLFKKFPSPLKMSKAKVSDLEELIKSIGLYKNKAKNILACSKIIQTDFSGAVPEQMEDLIKLPGVGRKTANVVLGNAFDKAVGFVVDTHVKRLSKLLKLTSFDDPVKIEQDLMKVFPKKKWTLMAHLFIFHGRKICKARTPQCKSCVLNKVCPSNKGA